MEDILLEIGAEEIPAGYIEPALSAMESTLLKKLTEARIDHGTARVYGTPRRLAVTVESVAPKQQPLRAEILGPPENIGFDEQGQPTVAAQKFAEKVGLKVHRLKVKQTPKGRYLCARKAQRGLATRTLLKDMLPQVILATPFPKTMKWGSLNILYARPIFSILALYGRQIVSFKLGNIKSGRATRGHSFMNPAKLKVASPADYPAILEKAHVLASIETRRRLVEDQIAKAAADAGGSVLEDPELVDIVTNLVEYPAATVGKFDREFLDLPDEILITAMREHQKYFGVVGGDGKLLPCFIAVNNTIARDMELVASGHERVIRARLADAQFFFKSDVQVPMDQQVEKLKGVLFQARLGSMYQKVKRVQKLAETMAESAQNMAAETPEAKLAAHVSRAALLSKADLVSQVVGEFPKLQGVMGRVYAAAAGEPGDVAHAIEEHYMPTRAGGDLPQTLTGAIVSIADKIDSICGCFSVGLAPTGVSDPYALRRQGIGVILIMLEKGLPFSLTRLIEKSLRLYGIEDLGIIEETGERIYDFLKNRMVRLLSDEGFSKDVTAAITAVTVDQVPDTWQRVGALERLKSEPDFEPLAAAYKRVVNIIRKAGAVADASADQRLFEHQSEEALYTSLKGVEKSALDLLEAAEYGQALREIASLGDAVDRFFEDVLVMAENKAVRENRLALLGDIARLFDRFADFSKISA